MWTRLTSYTQYGMTTMCVLRMYVYIVFKKIIHNQRERERYTWCGTCVCSLFENQKAIYKNTEIFNKAYSIHTYIVYIFVGSMRTVLPYSHSYLSTSYFRG